MLDHIVLFKLKAGTEKSQVEELYKNVSGLKDRIEGIVSVSHGENITVEDRHHDFYHAFVVRFTDAAARNQYLQHPEHAKVADTYIFPITEDILVFDLEV